MNGWLLYDKEGAARNEWFIAHLHALSEKYGMNLRLKITERGELPQGELPDFAIVRTICPFLNERLESLGVKTVNNALTSKTANDKYQTYLRCKEWGIPVLETWLYNADDPPCAEEYPLVLKTVDGHGGREVLWINEREELPEFTDGRKRILQKPSDVLGKDMRAYVVGGEIVACILRESEKDFRSNFSLGGKVKPVTPTAAQREIVRKLYGKLHFDYVGIDFLPDKTGWVLNEIEDSAGARMLYECTETDIAEVFLSHLQKKFS